MQVTALNSTLVTSNTEEQPAPVLNSDFETFLKMLTTQMQNQDPLNPVDSTEFATQLAMFTSVEQQVLTNDRLLSIQETLIGNELGQAADWVGKLARVEGDFVLGQAGMTFEFDPARTSDTRVFVIRDDLGQTVFTKPLIASDAVMSWDGDAGISGATYSPTIQTYDAEGHLVSEIAPAHYQRIEEIRLSQNGAMAILQDSSQVSLESIIALRHSEET